ncbi:MAG: transporter substrate-binding domain-containing protein [Aquabacterium sp.]
MAVRGAWVVRALCLVAGLLMQARADALEVVVFDEGSPPTMYADAQHASRGVYPAIVTRAFARMKVPMQAQARPFKRLIVELTAGGAGLGGIIRTPAREAQADFSRAYFTEHLRAYALVRGEVAPLPGLQGLTVGVIRGWSYGPQFDAARARGDFSVVEFSQDRQGFESLLQGRIDRMVSTELAAQALLRDARMARIQAAEGTVMSFGIHLAFAKRMHRADVLKAFDKAIDEMRRSGELDRIVQDEMAKAR